MGEFFSYLCGRSSGARGVNGFLCLHKISDNRITAPPASTIAAFGRFCGKGNDSCSRIVLVTTMWQEIDKEIGEFREKEIKSKYWVNGGRHVVRSNGTGEFVWDAVDRLLGIHR